MKKGCKEGRKEEKLSVTYVHMKKAREEGGNTRICSSQNLTVLAFRGANEMLVTTTNPVYGHTHCRMF